MTRDEFQAALVSALTARGDVLAVWLTGSEAAGRADPHSDLDLEVAVADAGVDHFREELPSIVSAAFDTVLVRRTGALTNIVTADWLRADVLVRSVSQIEHGVAPPARTLFDPNDLVTVKERQPAGDGRTASAIVEEFMRCLGLLPVVASRDEWIGAYIATGMMTNLLADLMQLENGSGRRVGGALRLNERLTPEQRKALESLPPVRPDRDSVISAQARLAQEFLPRARRMALDGAFVYPTRLEQALRHHLQRHGMDLLPAE